MNIKMTTANSARFLMPVIILATALNMNASVHAARPSMQGQEAGVYISSETLSSLESGPGEKFAANQKSLTLPLEQKKRRSEAFSSHFHLDITEFDWRGSTAAEKEYLWLSMPIHYEQQRGDKTLFLVDLEPGLMTDGGNIGFDHIGLNATVVGRRLWRNGGFWQYGLTVDRSFGDYDVRPVIGMAWQASKRTWIELGFPEINVKHHLSSALQSYFMLKPAGGAWKEEIKTDTATQDVSLQYRNWQLGIGADFHWRGSVWLNAEFGQLRNRRIRGYDGAAAVVKATPEESRYWRIGASLKY
jgi:hypothetical protein